MKYKIIFLLLVIYSLYLHAQKPPLPLDAYGVWTRGNIDNLMDFDGFKGIRANYEWSDIQPDDSLHFYWSALQNELIQAYESGLYVYSSIIVGPDSPEWIYENGVPKVYTDGDSRWSYFPYYLDPDYKRYYYHLIAQFADFVRSQPAHLTDRLAFVQLMIGCTGDVGPYKGTPLNPDYVISNDEWSHFNMGAFDQFKIHFNDGDNGKKIPLLFNGNAIHPEEDTAEWKWVNTNIDPDIGFGIKGSAYMRGHHLTGEKAFIDTWMPYLQNAKGIQIFSRGEMDQTWTWPLYQINLPLAFYWGMLSGLNTGLSVWDISGSASEYTSTSPEILDAFRFFNKHTAQIFPSTAKAAYVIFHEGLNSENTMKFPPEIFGEATQADEARYEAICQAYSERGAKMDDTYAATQGQVWQRHNQSGYNDAGWSIEEGNYEHWIEQIEPDETSIGLFRIRGTIDANSSKYDRFARSFEHATDKDTMYFKFHDDVFSISDPGKLTFTITWLDKIANSSWEFRYDNGEQALATAERFTGTGSGQWKTETIVLTDAKMQHMGPMVSDFALVNTDELDDIFHGIEVDIERVGDNLDTVAIDSPENGDEFIIGDSVVVSAVGYDLQGIERIRFSVDGKKKFYDDPVAPYEHAFKELTLGDHDLHVKMRDSIGYWLNAEPVTIEVIPKSDTVFIQLPPDAGEVLMGEDVTISAYGYDYDGIENLKFRVDEGSYHLVDAKPYKYTFSGLSEGTHIFDVQMTDLSGNNMMSDGITIKVVNPSDSVSILSPADGDTILLGESVRVTTYCYDSDGIERIRFRLDNADRWNNVFSPPYEYTFSGLSLGTHLIEVQMKDVNSDRILAESVTISVVPPDSVSITSPSDGGKITLGEDVLVTTSCYDSDGIETVGFRIDEESYIIVRDPPYEYTFTGLTIGTHTFEVKMNDRNANNIISGGITIIVVAPDSISISSPANGDTISLGEDVLVKTSSYDSDGIEAVGFSIDGGNYNTVADPPYEYTFMGLSEGFHKLQAQMTDSLGNNILSDGIEIYVEDQTQSSGSRSSVRQFEGIRVYPTMVESVLYWQSSTEVEEIYLYNLLGRKILSQKVDRQGEIELSKLDQGIYFIYFRYVNHLTIPQKIVKK